MLLASVALYIQSLIPSGPPEAPGRRAPPHSFPLGLELPSAISRERPLSCLLGIQDGEGGPLSNPATQSGPVGPPDSYSSSRWGSHSSVWPRLMFWSGFLASSPERPRPWGYSVPRQGACGHGAPGWAVLPLPMSQLCFFLVTCAPNLRLPTSISLHPTGQSTGGAHGLWRWAGLDDISVTCSQCPQEKGRPLCALLVCPGGQRLHICPPRSAQARGRPSASLRSRGTGMCISNPLHVTANFGSLLLLLSLSHPALTPVAESMPVALGGQGLTHRWGSPGNSLVAFEDKPRLLSLPCPSEPEAPEGHPHHL